MRSCCLDHNPNYSLNVSDFEAVCKVKRTIFFVHLTDLDIRTIDLKKDLLKCETCECRDSGLLERVVEDEMGGEECNDLDLEPRRS